jgi:hypothetical protein
MCNLYSHTSNRAAIAAMVRDIKRVQAGATTEQRAAGCACTQL